MLTTEAPRLQRPSQAAKDTLRLTPEPFVDGIVKYLGQVARERREKADVMLAEVCARFRQETGVKKTEGALSRFERGETTPTYLDAVVVAYAAELDSTPIELWADALKRWREADEAEDGPAKAVQAARRAARASREART